MESDIDVAIPSEKFQLEDKIEMLRKTIWELTMAKTNVWCSHYREEGHRKESRRHQMVRVIQSEQFYDICHNWTQHSTSDCPYNLKKQKQYWCAICEEMTHNTTDCVLNVKNHRSVYKTEVVEPD